MTEEMLTELAKIIDPGAFMTTATLYMDTHSQSVAYRKARQIADRIENAKKEADK